MDAERVQQLQDEVEDLRRRLENAKYLCDSYKHRAASAEASSARVTEELAYTKTQLLAVNARLQTLEKHRKLKMLRDEEIELLNNIAATTAQLQVSLCVFVRCAASITCFT
jgi:septal ring factor EnvC (AmiA/AmiB activator)